MTEKTSPLKNIANQTNSAIKSIYNTTKKTANNTIDKIPPEKKQKISEVCSALIRNFENHINYDISKIRSGNFNYCKAKFFCMLIGVIFFAMPGLFIGLIAGHFFDLSQKSDDFKKFIAESQKSKKEDKSAEDNRNKTNN